MSNICRELYALRSEIFEKLWVGMLFKFQWHTENFWPELGFGPGFNSTSLLKMTCKWNKSASEINSWWAETNINCKYKKTTSLTKLILIYCKVANVELLLSKIWCDREK